MTVLSSFFIFRINRSYSWLSIFVFDDYQYMIANLLLQPRNGRKTFQLLKLGVYSRWPNSYCTQPLTMYYLLRYPNLSFKLNTHLQALHYLSKFYFARILNLPSPWLTFGIYYEKMKNQLLYTVFPINIAELNG